MRESPTQLQSLVAVLARCGAVYLLLKAIQTGANAAALANHGDAEGWYPIAAAAIVVLLAVGIARVLVPASLADAVPARVDHAALETVVISLIGLFLVVSTVPALLISLSWALSQAPWNDGLAYRIAQNTLSLLLGLLLLIRAPAICRLVARLRSARA